MSLDPVLRLPIKLVSEANAHEHWRVRQKRAKAQRELVTLGLRQYTRPPLPCVVVIVRHGERMLDTDNRDGSAKHVRDAVAAWLGVDDRDPRVTWHVDQVKVKRGQEQVTIRVRPRDERDEALERARARVMEAA